MTSKYGDSDGNLYALDKYLDGIDKADAAFENVSDRFNGEAEAVANDFSKAMNRFYELKNEVHEALKDAGLCEDDENIMQILIDTCGGEDDIIEQMNTIDW